MKLAADQLGLNDIYKLIEILQGGQKPKKKLLKRNYFIGMRYL